MNPGRPPSAIRSSPSPNALAGVQRFASQRQESWDRLSALLDRAARGGVRSMSGPELLELGRLYRRAAADLALARASIDDPELVWRLNALVSRAHGTLYVGDRRRGVTLIDFFVREFPELLYGRRSFVLVAAAVFLAGALFAVARPDLKGFLIHSSYRTPEIGGGEAPQAAGFITQNNIQVSFMAFAGGATAGLLTLYLVFTNGLMLGAVGVLIHQKGESARFWPSIAPHGILELTAIMIAAGAGLLIGASLIAPGDRSRGRALAVATHDAVRLLAGTIPMFIVAGTIEGFISFSTLHRAYKIAVAAASAIAMVIYLSRKGTTEGDTRSE